jgi:hypothetical protein
MRPLAGLYRASLLPCLPRMAPSKLDPPPLTKDPLGFFANQQDSSSL